MDRLIYSMRTSLDGYTDEPELAAQAIRAGLVDEFQRIVCPAVGGGGKRNFPDGVRPGLELLEERRFGDGLLILRFGSLRNGDPSDRTS